MSVGRIASQEVDRARPNETAQAAAQRMQQRQVGTLVIVDVADRPVGILTDRDLVTRVMAAGEDANNVLIEQIMTPQPDTVTADTPIEQAVQTMQLRDGFQARLLAGEPELKRPIAQN